VPPIPAHAAPDGVCVVEPSPDHPYDLSERGEATHHNPLNCLGRDLHFCLKLVGHSNWDVSFPVQGFGFKQVLRVVPLLFSNS
jgi:hypothetical protein